MFVISTLKSLFYISSRTLFLGNITVEVLTVGGDLFQLLVYLHWDYRLLVLSCLSFVDWVFETLFPVTPIYLPSALTAVRSLGFYLWAIQC